jgi:hypothetical protein
MKTERLVLLTTPEFKAFVAEEAAREGVSVAELVRRRVEARPTDEEAILATLTAQLRTSLEATRTVVHESLTEVEEILRGLRAHRPAHKEAA